MKETEHLKLVKPEEDEFYNINDFNNNSDKIDAAIYGIIYILNRDRVTEAFKSTFTYLNDDPEPPQPIDPEAMTEGEIEDALSAEWDGSSSTDPYAMTKGEVNESINREWDGSSSTDPEAMSRDEIELAIANGEKL